MTKKEPDRDRRPIFQRPPTTWDKMTLEQRLAWARDLVRAAQAATADRRS